MSALPAKAHTLSVEIHVCLANGKLFEAVRELV